MDSQTTNATLAMPPSMNSQEKEFFRVLGARIAEARRSQSMTQVQLCAELDIAQQVLASYEVGRRRMPLPLLPRFARALGVAVEELIGEVPPPQKRGPAPKLLQQVERIQRLPKSQQRFVMQMIDTVLMQQQQADAAE